MRTAGRTRRPGRARPRARPRPTTARTSDPPGSSPSAGDDPPPPPSPALLSRPLLPVMLHVNGGGPPDFSTSDLTLIAEQSEAIWGTEWALPIGDDLDYLRSVHPGFTAIAYVNAGHEGSWPDTTQHPEDDRLNYVQMYRATELDGSIDALATEIPCGDVSAIPVTGGAVDAGVALYSLDGSTGPEGGFISFVRIDDEIMRVIEKTNTSPPRLVVIRGTDGSTASPHNTGVPILAPVYVKDRNPDSPDTLEAGSVRYSLNVGTPELAAMLASDFVERYMENGWDGAWLDITSPSFYNMVDALNADLDGVSRFPYNTVDGEDYTIWTRADHHDLKIGRIQTAVLASLGRLPVLAANNNGGGKWFEDGGYARRFAENNASKV